ncbi:hypothetical protein ACFWHQ_35655 [Streptomyces sp. NPDC060334]|uniref:hypothetical protein n=1 Tax=Streptomyces sp. NPDC060334 TaxID=3347099 RepID=UPI0036478633
MTVEEASTAAIDDRAVRRIVLDVTAIRFADSSMLNVMPLLLRTSRLVLAGPNPGQLGVPVRNEPGIGRVCPRAGGEGSAGCAPYEGTGQAKEIRLQQIRNPAGVRADQQVLLRGMGRPGRNVGAPGCLYVTVHIV